MNISSQSIPNNNAKNISPKEQDTILGQKKGTWLGKQRVTGPIGEPLAADSMRRIIFGHSIVVKISKRALIGQDSSTKWYPLDPPPPQTEHFDYCCYHHTSSFREALYIIGSIMRSLYHNQECMMDNHKGRGLPPPAMLSPSWVAQ